MEDVSVIIPCYNPGARLLRAIDSICRQDRSVREIIVVDDASTEKLPEVQSSENVQLVHLRLSVNSGPATARNMGIQQAKGQWLAFLDADEVWAPYKIRKQMDFLRAHPEYSLCASGAEGLKHLDHADAESFWREVFPRELLWKNPFRTSSIIVRRECLPAFPAGAYYSEDYACWLQLLFSGYRAALMDEVLVYFDRHPASAGGLSGDGEQMLRGEFWNFKRLAKQGHVSWFWAGIACGWSLLKFFRRKLMGGLGR
jgi:glycosyltransferase involved in cell wall biosynthesis